MADQYFQAEIECASREKIREIQSERLVKMVERCYENVPAYRKKLDDAGVKPSDIKSVDDISKLPFTYKQDFRDNYPYGLFAVPKEELVRIHASSGTTGKQTVVGYTQNDLDCWANCTARALAAAGATTSDFVHVSYGYGLFTGGLGLHYGAEKLGATAIPVSSGNTKRQIGILQDMGSNVLCCTPSYAMFIGETLKDMNVDSKDLPLRIGIFGAEAWSENMRKQIEESLNIKAYDIYGMSELSGPGVSYECSAQDGMHINEDYFYAEIIDPDTCEVLPDGEYGELVFTCIAKEALPLIRYRTRDICKLTHEKCSCGRTTVKMSRVTGRSDDMLIIRGVNVFPSQIEHVIIQLGMEPNYVIVVERQNNLDKMEIRIEMSDAFFSDSVRKIEETEQKIQNAMQSILGVASKIKLVEPRSLPRSEGKAQRIIDNRKY